ncbi:DUF1972 domain-containing protein [Planktomarina temperata]|nr:DUF1972 domain-containing protein [Planktomarina temperata]
MAKTRVAIIGIAGIPARYGGFETFVETWMDMSACRESYLIYCEKKYSRMKSVLGLQRRFVPFKANGAQSLVYDVYSIMHAVLIERVDVLVVLGISGSWIFPLLKLFFPKVRIIINTDGLEWKRDKWSTWQKKVLLLLEYYAVKYGDIVVVDNGALVTYVAAKYGVIPRLISYGHEHCITNFQVRREASEEYFLCVCRIEPENNCQTILNVFASKPSKKLIFVGNWQSSKYSSALYQKFSDFPNIQLIGPEYDPEVLFRLRSGCVRYIHGHSVGGTNPSLIEIMTYSKPIIAHDNAFNRWALKDRASFFDNETSLSLLIDNHENSESDWSDLLEADFSWRSVIKSYEDLITKPENKVK